MRFWSKLPLGWLLLLLALAPAAYSQSVFFSRSFPKSMPPYFEVDVAEDGTVTYREEPDEEDPLTFQLSAEDRDRLIGWVRAASTVDSISSDRKVAFTGDKVLRLEGAEEEAWEAKFVHSEVPEVAEAVRWFSHVSETERHRIELERAAVFDRLGVNKALLYFQRSMERDRVVAPKQFLPILRRIANGKAYLQMARSRAASLAEQIDSGPEAPPSQ